MTIVRMAIRKIQKKLLTIGNAGIAARAANGFDVVQEDNDDLAEAERDDRQVVALQTKRRHTDNQARETGKGRADQRRQRQRDGPTQLAVAQGWRQVRTIVNREIGR